MARLRLACLLLLARVPAVAAAPAPRSAGPELNFTLQTPQISVPPGALTGTDSGQALFEFGLDASYSLGDAFQALPENPHRAGLEAAEGAGILLRFSEEPKWLYAARPRAVAGDDRYDELVRRGVLAHNAGDFAGALVLFAEAMQGPEYDENLDDPPASPNSAPASDLLRNAIAGRLRSIAAASAPEDFPAPLREDIARLSFSGSELDTELRARLSRAPELSLLLARVGVEIRRDQRVRGASDGARKILKAAVETFQPSLRADVLAVRNVALLSQTAFEVGEQAFHLLALGEIPRAAQEPLARVATGGKEPLLALDVLGRQQRLTSAARVVLREGTRAGPEILRAAAANLLLTDSPGDEEAARAVARFQALSWPAALNPVDLQKIADVFELYSWVPAPPPVPADHLLVLARAQHAAAHAADPAGFDAAISRALVYAVDSPGLLARLLIEIYGPQGPESFVQRMTDPVARRLQDSSRKSAIERLLPRAVSGAWSWLSPRRRERLSDVSGVLLADEFGVERAQLAVVTGKRAVPDLRHEDVDLFLRRIEKRLLRALGQPEDGRIVRYLGTLSRRSLMVRRLVGRQGAILIDTDGSATSRRQPGS